MQKWSVLIIVRLLYCTTLWVKKQDTKLLSTSSPSIDRFSTFFSLLHSTLGRQFAIKRSLHIQPKLKGVATLSCEILVSKKLQRLTAQQQHTKRARTVKECDRDWRAAAKQLWRHKKLSFSTSNSTICGHKDHFLHSDLGLKCPKRRLLKNWLKQTVMRDLSAQNSCWMMLSLFGSCHKKLFTLAQQKKSQKGRL